MESFFIRFWIFISYKQTKESYACSYFGERQCDKKEKKNMAFKGELGDQALPVQTCDVLATFSRKQKSNLKRVSTSQQCKGPSQRTTERRSRVKG